MSSDEKATEQTRLGEIRSDVRHIQSDVTDLKAEVRQLRVDLTGRIDKLEREDLKEMRQEFNSFKVEVTREFGSLRTEMHTGFQAVRTEIQAVRTTIEASKRWMIVAGAGLISTTLGALATLGRVMKWF